MPGAATPIKPRSGSDGPTSTRGWYYLSRQVQVSILVGDRVEETVDIKRKLGKLSGFNVRNTECLHSP